MTTITTETRGDSQKKIQDTQKMNFSNRKLAYNIVFSLLYHCYSAKGLGCRNNKNTGLFFLELGIMCRNSWGEQSILHEKDSVLENAHFIIPNTHIVTCMYSCIICFILRWYYTYYAQKQGEKCSETQIPIATQELTRYFLFHFKNENGINK